MTAVFFGDQFAQRGHGDFLPEGFANRLMIGCGKLLSEQLPVEDVVATEHSERPEVGVRSAQQFGRVRRFGNLVPHGDEGSGCDQALSKNARGLHGRLRAEHDLEAEFFFCRLG